MIVPKHRIRALHNFDWNKHWIQIHKVDGLAVYSAQDVEVVTPEDHAVLDVGHRVSFVFCNFSIAESDNSNLVFNVLKSTKIL